MSEPFTLKRRTEGERAAYFQGYRAALDDLERAVEGLCTCGRSGEAEDDDPVPHKSWCEAAAPLRLITEARERVKA